LGQSPESFNIHRAVVLKRPDLADPLIHTSHSSEGIGQHAAPPSHQEDAAESWCELRPLVQGRDRYLPGQRLKDEIGGLLHSSIPVFAASWGTQMHRRT
jgi:hypothetical protein